MLPRSFTPALALILATSFAPACKPSAPPACPPKKYDPPVERFVFFTTGKTDVQPDGYFAVGYVVAQLDADPALEVLIVGHADQRGRTEANRELSFKRARAVRRLLMEKGVKDKRIRVAAPKEQNESTLSQLSRRADLFVYDPKQDEAQKRLGYAVEIKGE